MVLALSPEYVVPLTVSLRTFCWKSGSLETTAAVKWLVMRSKQLRTLSIWFVLKSVTIWKGPKISVVKSLNFFSVVKFFSGTYMAVGSYDP